MAKKAESGGYARLKGDLAQKTPGSFYVLYGEEDYLRRYYLSMLRRQLVDGPTEDFNFHRLTSENFSMQVLSESLEALPMMAERTMIQVDDVDLFALPEDDRTQLAALFSDIPDYACLVLVYADFKPDKRKKKLWDAMEKNAVLAEFAYQTERDLTAWIVRHFRAEKENISSALCGYLAAALRLVHDAARCRDREDLRLFRRGRHCPRRHRRRRGADARGGRLRDHRRTGPAGV